MNIKERWESTGLLNGLAENNKEPMANLLEGQRLHNENISDDGLSGWKRISIPMARRIYASLENMVEGSTESLSKWHIFENVKLGINGMPTYIVDYVPNKLDMEVEKIVKLVEHVSKSMPECVTKIHCFSITPVMLDENFKSFRYLRMNYE